MLFRFHAVLREDVVSRRRLPRPPWKLFASKILPEADQSLVDARVANFRKNGNLATPRSTHPLLRELKPSDDHSDDNVVLGSTCRSKRILQQIGARLPIEDLSDRVVLVGVVPADSLRAKL